MRQETESAIKKLHDSEQPKISAQDSFVSVNAEEIKNLREENENLKLASRAHEMTN